ncbi:unnamed protein product [Vitrella brassicaformis CCMP3155]|uniref:Centrosomal protein of 44 kDa n=2 Tax=Vitrella brassicaformis TaxID=1169539 RepID=A0A0G4G4P1_VITBC|nr:unnamed protein product [Vitrella brassicaformis CCMP3155]|eukprot:CEM23376.1 unnamed protein product [Vitrella brassicaformis CCMP3155]
MRPSFVAHESVTEGTLKQHMDTLKTHLRKINRESLTREQWMQLQEGVPAVYLSLLHYVVFEWSPYVPAYLLDQGYAFRAAADRKFIDNIYKLLREEFRYEPDLPLSLFFNTGAPLKKLQLLCRTIQHIMAKHHELHKASHARHTHHHHRRPRPPALGHTPSSAPSTSSNASRRATTPTPAASCGGGGGSGRVGRKGGSVTPVQRRGGVKAGNGDDSVRVVRGKPVAAGWEGGRITTPEVLPPTLPLSRPAPSVLPNRHTHAHTHTQGTQCSSPARAQAHVDASHPPSPARACLPSSELEALFFEMKERACEMAVLKPRVDALEQHVTVRMAEMERRHEGRVVSLEHTVATLAERVEQLEGELRQQRRDGDRSGATEEGERSGGRMDEMSDIRDVVSRQVDKVAMEYRLVEQRLNILDQKVMSLGNTASMPPAHTHTPQHSHTSGLQANSPLQPSRGHSDTRFAAAPRATVHHRSPTEPRLLPVGTADREGYEGQDEGPRMAQPYVDVYRPVSWQASPPYPQQQRFVGGGHGLASPPSSGERPMPLLATRLRQSSPPQDARPQDTQCSNYQPTDPWMAHGPPYVPCQPQQQQQQQ